MHTRDPDAARQAGRALSALLVLVLSALGCDALDPVQTVNLCAGGGAVISGHCEVCRKPPYAASCPQCQGKPTKDSGCENASDAATPSGADARASEDGAAQDAAQARDGASAPSVDGAQLAADGGGRDSGLDGGVVDAGLVGLVDAGPDASARDADVDAGPCGGPCAGDLVCSPENTCEECNLDADCKASAPRCVNHDCVACTGTDTSCDGRDKSVCDTAAWSSKHGQCVECTGTSHVACDAAPDTTPYVCNSLTRACTELKEHSVGDCAPCVSDAQCQDGQLCAAQTFGTPAEHVGYFCFWKKDATVAGGPAGNCDTAAPLVKAVAGVVSVDHVVAAACVARASSCPALNDVAKSCESKTAPGTPDAALCGFSHSTENYVTHENQDGICVDTDPTAATSWKCTVPCLEAKDCKLTSTCDTAPTPDQCTL